MSIFGILTWVCVGFVFVVFIIAIISVSQWVMWHYLRKCKCCGHLMKFKGFREDKEDGMKHEYGHTIQSRILGPFYLIIIGLPSLIGNIYDQIAHKNWSLKDSCIWYYNQPWEKWADKLGGVDRQSYINKLVNK